MIADEQTGFSWGGLIGRALNIGGDYVSGEFKTEQQKDLDRSKQKLTMAQSAANWKTIGLIVAGVAAVGILFFALRRK